MKVSLLREKDKQEDVLHELLLDADSAMLVDCASSRVNFVQAGWFVFPKGSLSKAIEVERAA